MSLLKLLTNNPKALLGVVLVSFFILASAAAPLLTDYDPQRRVGKPHQPPSEQHLLGTSRMGYDIYSQLLYGGRTSLAVGIGAGTLVTLLAVVLGISSGYFGGKADEIITFFTNVVLVIPNLPLLLVLAAFLGEVGPWIIGLIIGLTSWAWGCRIIRAQTLALREKEFVRAAELIGEPAWRILFCELLPNLVSIIGITFIGSVIYAIMTEATLEFIGLGDPLAVTWGTMLYHAQNSSALLVGAWWEILTPCIAIATLGAGLSLLNFAVDEIANPALRNGRALKRWQQMQLAIRQEAQA
ncbi:ABC transporter permease [Balneatrix alpica]|uniref:ABC transporter permease n=1 Tax=Balneatrix alpica TaxID=75684 RepID=A0ABV5ZFL6_9GAMM|nr:ABC transporter permease [Balneatrix alpica]